MKKSLFIMAISIILLLSITATFASDVNDNETIANEIDESIMETSDEVESPDMLLDYVESEESASDITDEEDLSSESDILKEGDESEKMYGYWVNSVDTRTAATEYRHSRMVRIRPIFSHFRSSLKPTPIISMARKALA